jgi:hypothetical protein
MLGKLKNLEAVYLQPTEPLSIDFRSYANDLLIWGICNIFLGWSVIAPILGLASYYDLWRSRGMERVPWQATIGTILTLVFGVSESMMMLRLGS